MKYGILAAIGLTATLGLPAFAANDPAGEVRTFGIVPQQSASRLAQMWGPFLNKLGEETGTTFRFRTAKDIPTFEACLAEGAYDVAYMNPMHYAIFSEESGYRAFARQADKRLKGIIVTRKDAALDDLSGLENAQVAFPSPGAFGASILTRAALTDMGVDFEPAYVNSHDSVYRAVAAGLMPAGGGVMRTFNATSAEIRDELTIVYETEAFTPHAFAVSANADADFTADMQQAFLRIAEENPELVSGIGMVGLQIAADGDWNDVRALEMSHEESGILQEGELTCPSD
ncbi:phosphate/phosphite/phosphonate ABC transporter substrate-binding protein [Amaricoccus macauensis]|uniref:phosphate/phosphite/phosphonate ABC transporter substrate-binding protein n=1 Tax=Amaricoccus macauensis TaxID=57001 RepID=UPI003C7D21C6